MKTSGRRNRGNSSISQSSRRNLKRKFEDEPGRIVDDSPIVSYEDLVAEARSQIKILESMADDPIAVKHAIGILSELAKNEEIASAIVDCAAVPLLVRYLQASSSIKDGDASASPFEYELEKWSALTLGLLAINPEHQRLIADTGALRHLIALLKRHKDAKSQCINDVIRNAADAITNLAHENSNITTLVRIEGGIPPLVELLEYVDPKVQRAAAGALRTIAFKNDENKIQIVECNALPKLVLLLRYQDDAIYSEAVGVIGNLVHSSPNIKSEVLAAGALQPIIELLRSHCPESQREAALLIGQFATDSDSKVQIVQRGAVMPLIEMLQSFDVQLQEMSSFALGRLAQETHNQAGIVHSNGIVPLLKLLESKNASLQQNAAFTLYGLANNDDNVAEFVRLGAVKKLRDGEFIGQATKECVSRTLKRLEENMHGRVLCHLLYMMRTEEKVVQRLIAIALAHLCSPDDLKVIFVDNNGLALLLELLESTHPEHQRDGSFALCRVAYKANSLSPMNAAPPSPMAQVHLGKQYINNPALSDVTFLVEGKAFHAHKICLCASSDTFRAMFDGPYRERDAKNVEIPNISWEVFEQLMSYIYTGSLNVGPDIAHDLLRAADQYLLEGLKLECEHAIVRDISVENVSAMFDLSDTYNALHLRQCCILFILEQYDNLSIMPWYSQLIQHVLPETRDYFVRVLARSKH